MYFKDIPGHGMSGMLPKLYSALIRKGETQKVYLLANNGRVYFAFGEGWGTLAKPVALSLQDTRPYGNTTERKFTLYLDRFFSSGKTPVQKYLLHPLLIEKAGPIQGGDMSGYLNTTPGSGNKETVLTLSSSGASAITISARGPLLVKETGH
jgi:hypothetical protein